MPEHEPLDISDKDNESPRQPEARAARMERASQAGADRRPRESHAGDVRSDEAQAASEPMDLQRLPDGKAPPGRQRTGDPPAGHNEKS
jgi:hypothetical protein